MTYPPPTCPHCGDSGVLNILGYLDLDDPTSGFHDTPTVAYCHACPTGEMMASIGVPG